MAFFDFLTSLPCATEVAAALDDLTDEELFLFFATSGFTLPHSDWRSNWTRTELVEGIVDFCWTYGKAA